MKITFLTQGCRANKADEGWLTVLAKRKNFTIVDDVVSADAAIINTCTVTHGADRDCRMLVRKVQRLNPEVRVCLVGCYSQMQVHEARTLPGVDYIGGTGSKERVLDFLETASPRGQAPFEDSETFSRQGFLRGEDVPSSESTTRLFLKIQDGCNHRCTYCIIHSARGASRSLSSDEVLSLMHRASQLGYREVVLTGIDLGSFGGGLEHLLRRINQEKPVPRVRISSLSPKEISDELIEVVAESTVICPSFHISLQHGSPKILKRMARGYGPELFVSRTERIRSFMIDASISFDVIVGFPGEGPHEFEELTTLLASTPWTRGHYFPFSARAGTPSATMDAQVPSYVKTDRMNVLLGLDDARYRSEQEKWIGREVDVLIEKSVNGIHVGHSRENFPITLIDSTGKIQSNDCLRLRVTSLNECGLEGQRNSFIPEVNVIPESQTLSNHAR